MDLVIDVALMFAHPAVCANAVGCVVFHQHAGKSKINGSLYSISLA